MSEDVLMPCIVDSGATSHLIRATLSHLLHHSREPLGVGVKDASGNSMRVTTVGSIHLKLVCGRKVTLRDVLAVEGLQRVIVSLSSADKDGWSSRQANGAMVLQSPAGGELQATVKRGSYAARLTAQQPRREDRVFITVATPATVHESLGHAGKDRIAKVIACGAMAVPSPAQARAAARRNTDDVCSDCVETKATAKKHTASSTEPKQPLEERYADLCDVGVLGLKQERYFLTLVDRATGAIAVRPIKGRTDTEEAY